MSYQGRQEAGAHQEIEHVLPSLEESRWDRRNAMHHIPVIQTSTNFARK